MKVKSFFLFAAFLFLTLSAAYPQANRCIPENLRCEYLINPIGIDSPAPRLSWLLNDKRYGALQHSYRVVIGTDSLLVANGTGDSWDSGRVESDMMLVNYTGNSLEPFTRYFWGVQVWI
jgi:alpha-L-rhamnosidase